MNYLSLLSWSNFWTSCGLIALLSMIWFSGPLVSIADYKPLASIWARIALSSLIILVVILFKAYQWHKAKKLNQNVIEELKASEVISELPNKPSLIAKRFADVDLVLQNHSKNNKNQSLVKWFTDQQEYIYQKPWFLLIGAPGVGKTSSILNAGLTFPIEMSDNISKLAGTQDCDWFLTDEALFLDTAGRFVDQNDDQQNIEDWQELLALLKRCRTKQPINGLVLMLSVEDVVNGDNEQIKKQLHQIRLRLQELQKNFKTTFPLYIIINKMDLITGFEQFFQHLGNEERKKALGVTLDTLGMTNAEKMNTITTTLAHMSERFKQHLFYSVSANRQQHESSNLALVFPAEFENFAYILNSYLKKLLNISQYDLDLNLAGLYFSSVQQQQDNLFISDEIDSYHLQHKYHDTPHVKDGTPYFIHAIFNHILLNTADIAGVDKQWLKKNKILYWLGCTGVGIFTILCVLAIIQAYQKNNDKLDHISSNLSKTEQQIQYVSPQQLDSILDIIQQIFNIAKDNQQYYAQSSWLDLGLTPFTDLEKLSSDKYNTLIDTYIIPFISGEIDQQLKYSIDTQQLAYIYRNLKAYLMLYQPEHYNEAFIAEWITQDLLPNSTLLNIKSAHQKNMLQQILTNKRIISSKTYDANLVEQARFFLAQQEFSTVIYQNLLDYVKAMDKRNLPMVSFVSMGGNSTSTLFRRLGNRTLNTPIEILYTQYGYQSIFVPYINSQLQNLYYQEPWVMGKVPFSKTEQQSLAELYQLYSADYITAWQDYIKDIQMLQPKDLQQAIAMAKQLSEKNSSLASIIRGISENTSLSIPKPVAEQVGANSKNVKELSTKVETISINHSNMQGYLQQIASRFSTLHGLTQHSAESPAQLDEIINSIDSLYIYLVALQMSMQNNDELLPDNKPLTYYRAQVSRLPDPFKPMLDGFVGQISNANKVYQQDLQNHQQQELVYYYDQNVKQECIKVTQNRYPFNTQSEQDAPLQALNALFGKDGLYAQSEKMNVSVQANKKTPYKTILANMDANRIKHYEAADKLRLYYFLDQNQPHIDFSIKVIAMDKMIDQLNFSYANKNMSYYHGPQKNIFVEWPNKQNTIKLDVRFADKKTYQLEASGDWSLFRFLDKAEKIIPTADGKGILATFTLNKQKIHLEFKSTSKNVFNLNEFREFSC